MFKCILHATDLSENHYNYCEAAKALADSLQAKLYIVHVIEVPTSLQIAQTLGFAELIKPAKTDALEVLKILGDSINVPESQLFVEIGGIKNRVLEVADKIGADLIVLGAHSKEGFKDILGSTAEAIMHAAPCNVLTLK